MSTIISLTFDLLISLRISRLRASLVDLETQLRHHSSAVSYFKSLAGRQVDATIDDDACIICFEPMTRLTVTPCGHLFCFDCITSCLTANGLCPTCRRNVRPDQLVEVKKPTAAPAVASDDISKKEELQQLTEKFGTKMAYLIFYLRYLFIDSPHSRVIVFSPE